MRVKFSIFLTDDFTEFFSFSGKEVVKEIEELDTDKKDRPLQDVRVANCGELIRKSKPTKKKSAASEASEAFSSSSSRYKQWAQMGQNWTKKGQM